MVRAEGALAASLRLCCGRSPGRCSVPFRLPDPAPDPGGNRKPNRGPAGGNPSRQRRPVRGTRLACVRGGGGRAKRSREYLGLPPFAPLALAWLCCWGKSLPLWKGCDLPEAGFRLEVMDLNEIQTSLVWSLSLFTILPFLCPHWLADDAPTLTTTWDGFMIST